MTEFTTLDLVGTITAALLTVMVLSYLLGDNIFFRFAVYLFIGVTAGYAGSIAWHNVIWPGLIDPLVSQELAGVSTALQHCCCHCALVADHIALA